MSGKKCKSNMKLSKDSISALVKKSKPITTPSKKIIKIKDEDWKSDISNDQLINPEDFQSIEIESYATKQNDNQKVPITLIDFASNTIAIKSAKNSLEQESEYSFVIAMSGPKCNLNFSFDGKILEKHSIDPQDDLLIVSTDNLNSHPFSQFKEQLQQRQNEIIQFLKEIKGLD